MTNDGPPVRIDRFRALMREAGVEEIVEETLGIYAQEGPARLERMVRALEAGDAPGVEMEAHALRSASLNIWAEGLAHLLEQAEAAGSDGDLDTVRGLLEPITLEAERVTSYIQAVLGEAR